eukprot:IDg8148t1
MGRAPVTVQGGQSWCKAVVVLLNRVVERSDHQGAAFRPAEKRAPL